MGWAIAVIAGLVAGARGELRAQPSDAGLVWRAPASCPEMTELRARVERRFGGPLDRAVQGISVDVSAEGNGAAQRFVARIDGRVALDAATSGDVRVLTSARCDELTDAVAVVIARIAAERRQPAVPSEPVARVVAPSPERRAQWGGGVRALGISGIGALPGVGVAGELAGYVRRRELLVELAAARWAKTAGAFSPGADEVSLDLIVLRVGWEPEDLPLRAWLVGERGAYAGVMFERGEVEDVGWSAAGAGFGVMWRMTSHTRLFGMVELVAPLERARIMLPDRHDRFRPDSASARSGFGLEVGWP